MKIAVLGAGTMGNGIAQVFAQHGHDVVLRDLRAADPGTGEEHDRAQPQQAGRQGPAHAGRSRRVARARACHDRPDSASGSARGRGGDRRGLRGQDGAVPRARHASWRRRRSSPPTPRRHLDHAQLAAATTRPDRVIGMHFMNPVPLMSAGGGHPRARATSDETTRTVMDLVARARQDAGRGERLPGLRLQPRAHADDQRGHLRGLRGSGHGRGHRPGHEAGHEPPDGAARRSRDFIGLDVCLAILNVLHDGLGDPEVPSVPAAEADGGRAAGSAARRAGVLQLHRGLTALVQPRSAAAACRGRRARLLQHRAVALVRRPVEAVLQRPRGPASIRLRRSAAAGSGTAADASS